MRGCILYKRCGSQIPPEAYEIRRLLEEAAGLGIDLTVSAPEQFDLVVTRDDRKSVRIDGEVRPLPDFLLPRMGSGTTYFALAVMRHLERLGVQPLNSSESIEIVKDKLWSIQVLAASQLPIAKTILVKQPFDAELAKTYLGFPLVVKALSGSHGRGVFLCEDEQRLDDIMGLVASTGNVNLILQEYIETSRGRDLRVITVGGRAIGAMLRQSTDGSFKANISRGGFGEPFPLTPEIEWLATEAARVVGLDIAGIDLLFDGDHFRICEANSSPGFEGFEPATGINVARQILEFAAVRLGRIDAIAGSKRTSIADQPG